MSWMTKKTIRQQVKREEEITSGGGAELENRFKSLKSMGKEQTEVEDLFSGKNGSYLSRKAGKWR